MTIEKANDIVIKFHGIPARNNYLSGKLGKSEKKKLDIENIGIKIVIFTW